MTVFKVAVSLIAGIVVIVLLIPASGVDTLPPTCWSVFGYEVPCGPGPPGLAYASLAYAAGAATAAVVGFAFWLDGRRRKRRR